MARVLWPTMEEVEAGVVSVLLNWNQRLPAPAWGTAKYGILARIVERLRDLRASADKVPEPDHPGWPLP